MKNERRVTSLCLALVVVLSSLVIGVRAEPQGDSGGAFIESPLLERLRARGSADFFVVMVGRADLSPAHAIADWSARGWAVYYALRETADASQAPVIEYAQEHGLRYRSFFSVNAVHIQGGTLEVAQELASLPGVEWLRLEQHIPVEEKSVVESLPGPEAYGWNLGTLDPGSSLYGMQAAQVWDQYGITGQGVVVANIDTGVYYQHEALDRQYRGNLTGNVGGPYDHNYHWYMPTSGCPDPSEPCDNNGHGSGTMGIMVGETEDQSEQIGVAPGATWIACKGCESNYCSLAALMACGDWILAPTMTDGSNPNPDMRPHIVNNSWGGPGCDLWYQPWVTAWWASGILPIFSTGGVAACAALGSPGDYLEAFTPSAHMAAGYNLYAGGPSCFAPNPSCDPDAHQVKPNVNAPTFGRTAGNSQGQYYDLGGSSGSAPHAAGVAALLWSANPSLVRDLPSTFTILEQSANPNAPLGSCGQPACAIGNVPNYEYGWGYLDGLAAVMMAGGQGTLDGTVTEQGTGSPLEGVAVLAERVGGGSWDSSTDASGYYTLTLTNGVFTVTAEGPQHAASVVTGVVVLTGTTSTQDFELLPHPPEIALEPLAFEAVLGANSQITQTLLITNSGLGPLYFSISEEDGKARSVGRGPWNRELPWLAVNPVTGTVPAGEMLGVDVIFDSGPVPGPGVYTASLALDHNDPLTRPYSLPVTMTVLASPLCDFASSSPDWLGETTILTNTSTGAEPLNFLWQLGDRITSTLRGPTHTYAAVGVYTVILTVTNRVGQDSCLEEISIRALPVYLPLLIRD